jgi:hypothetical protein
MKSDEVTTFSPLIISVRHFTCRYNNKGPVDSTEVYVLLPEGL